jgi:hypothetical protein
VVFLQCFLALTTNSRAATDDVSHGIWSTTPSTIAATISTKVLINIHATVYHNLLLHAGTGTCTNDGNKSKFKCTEGIDVCITMEWVNDGSIDCADQSDESGYDRPAMDKSHSRSG